MNPHPTAPDNQGAGVFGHWSEDADGRPVYVYTIDHTRDPRALYNTSLGPSRNHWHQVGTGEFVATVHNAGYAQIYDWSRGGKLLNRWDPANGHFGGGFLLIELNSEAFSTLWEGLPEGATQSRRWGCNYAERVTRYKGIEITERLDGNNGGEDFGELLFSWSIRNTGAHAATCKVVAPWWLNIQNITPAPIMTGGLRRWVEKRRARLNKPLNLFGYFCKPDAPEGDYGGYLRTGIEWKKKRWINWRHYSVNNRILINDDMNDLLFFLWTGVKPRVAMFPRNSFEYCPRNGLPRGFKDASFASIDETQDCSAGAVVALVYDLDLPPQEILGAQTWLTVDRFDDEVIRKRGGRVWARQNEIVLETPATPRLSRELRWHSAYLLGGTHFDDYHTTHFIDQGSAYSYLQGLSGAPRDFALFVLPMVYLYPALAKEMLRHMLSSQHHRTGKLPYANVGYGLQRGYLVHSFSSDLDLFLLWATAEYLGATRDFGFLEEVLPFYPHDHDGPWYPLSGERREPKNRRTKGTVLEHLRAAFVHLRDRVGLGPHGLLRCGSGDWNDVLLGFSRIPPLTWLRGESSLNAGLAALALPRLADALGDTAPEFSAELRAYGEAQAVALKTLWTGRWAARGYLGYGNKKLGEDRLFLDTQAFGVLAGVWDDAQRATLFENIDALCVQPQKVGALALWPPMKGPLLVEGSDTNGGTWAAIDGLLAWAWAQHDPQRAWEFYQSTTLAARADAYPEVWYGVWSGPDSFNAHYHARPGETFCHNFTPMTDFPIMNMNRHALPLLDAIKFAGIEPRNGVIEIRPRIPGGVFQFKSTLIDIASDGHQISGEYRPICTGTFRFRIAIPGARGGEAVWGHLNGERVDFICDTEGMVFIEAGGSPSQSIDWEFSADISSKL